MRWNDSFGFVHAEAYRKCLASPMSCREPDGRDPFLFSERHLQCVWYDPQLRPDALITSQGEPVTVLSPGRWNEGPGPDFLEAELLAGNNPRRLQGDVELHIHPNDWQRHRHAIDPRYAHVIAHVTYQQGTVDTKYLGRHVLQISLRESLHANPDFFFESIDIAAYPFDLAPAIQPNAHTPVLQNWSTPQRIALLEAAGEERLRQKTTRMARRIQNQGEGETLYQEILAALGYHRYSRACRLLAIALPLERLQQTAKNDPFCAYAILLGCAGLLPANPPAGADDDTTRLLQKLWAAWWRKKETCGTKPLAREAWEPILGRPQNHPLRRLAAAAALFASPKALPQTLPVPSSTATREWLQDCLTALDPPESPFHDYWRAHLSLEDTSPHAPVSLLGPGRKAAIFNNILLPWAALRQTCLSPLLPHLPTEDLNRPTREMACILFGHDHNPSLYRNGIRRQGLLQLYQDFVLQPDRSFKQLQHSIHIFEAQ